MNRSALAEGSSGATRVLIVDDHQLLAESLAMALRRRGLDVEIASPSGADAVVDVGRAYRPHLVLLDLDLGGLSGRDLVGPLREATEAAVLVLTGTTDRLRMGECLEAGAVGVASKTQDFRELLDQIVRVVEGRPPGALHERDALLAELRLRRSEAERRLAPFRGLTPKEQFVLACLMEGKRPQQIAAESFVGVGTVRAQIKAIHHKLEVGSQLAAVALARQAGWPGPEAALPAS